MKQKLFTGISLMAFAGVSFWACGEGSINKMDETDNLMAMQYGDHDAWVAFKEEQKNACKADIDNCYIQYHEYIDGVELPPEDNVSSASENGGTPNQTPRSSSSQGAIDIDNNGPTSSATIVDPGQTTTSSSSVVISATDLGKCGPAYPNGKKSVSRGEAVAWKFEPNTDNPNYKGIDFGYATYVWDLGGMADDGSGVGSTSGKVAYTEPGPQNASVTVTMKDGATQTVACTPVQVDGDPITCTCTSAAEIVDYSTGATATWELSCTSASEITGYVWSVATGTGATGTYSFTKPETVKPTVVVSNSTLTNYTVETCPEVEGSNGPKNNIDLATATDAQKTLEDGVLYTVTHPYSSAISFNGSTPSCSIEVNGEAVSVGHYSAIQPAPASPMTVKPVGCTATIGGY